MSNFALTSSYPYATIRGCVISGGVWKHNMWRRLVEISESYVELSNIDSPNTMANLIRTLGAGDNLPPFPS